MKKNYKIFFNSSARSSSVILENAKRIFDFINSSEKYSLTYNTFADGTEEEIYSGDESDLKSMYLRATKALTQSDLCILEISTHSLSQGYLLEKALEQSKPTIALYMPGKLPAFAAGIHNDRLQVLEYNSHDVIPVLKQAIAYAQEDFDIRFNMMLSPVLNNYLKEQARKKKISRSSCVRELIRSDMLSQRSRHN